MSEMKQLVLQERDRDAFLPLRHGLLKWVGNKQRYAPEIISYFPKQFDRYFEPFVGSGAVLASLSPSQGLAADIFEPLVQIWRTLSLDPDLVKTWYEERWSFYKSGDPVERYEEIKASYNMQPNGRDLLFLSRSCYAGIVRFRKSDGYMSTPCGPHQPIRPQTFNQRVDEWAFRLRGTSFRRADYRELMEEARKGDIVYCDPPYLDSQSILYGAQSFNLVELFEMIARCKDRGVRIALSIDGTKRSGLHSVQLPIPDRLFEREIPIDCGRSMLRRLQMQGQTLESEMVTDRLLLTY